MVKLSVIIPTRNRQKYCITTIKSLAKSDQQNIEFVVGDNSDDPDVMAEFFQDFDDQRFKFVPSGERIYSMVENWNRLVPFSSGEWLCFIGDDDYIDPELPDFIEGLQASFPQVDALNWMSFNYVWPDLRGSGGRLHMSANSGVYMQTTKEMLRRVYYWDGAADRPVCGYGIYHSAQKRELIETVRETFGGEYFVHQIVDYENICKTILVAKGMVLSERPFSVQGACAASNSAAIAKPELTKAVVDKFMEEVNQSKMGAFHPKNFPFQDSMGLTAVIGATILWVIQEYGLDVKGWEPNFVKACQNFCEMAPHKEEYNIRKKAYRQAIREWEDGQYLKHFNPKPPRNREGSVAYQGLHKNRLHLDHDLNGISLPGDAFDALKAAMPSVEFMIKQLDRAKKAA